MKNKILIAITSIIVIVIMMQLVNCSSSEEEPEPNKAPTCSITNPSNNSTIAAGSTVQITVSASDTDGSISNVKISIDDLNATTLQSSPYSYDWNTSGVAPGRHTIKAIATDNGNLTANAQITVTVTADAPTVTTADVSEIAGETATCGGNVTDDGGVSVTARGVVWGDTSGPTLESNTGKTTDGSGTGTFVSNLTGLTTNTTYYVKAYATNSQGTAYGEEKSFATLALPTVVIGMLQSYTNESAEIVNNDVTDDGGSPVTARGLVWGTMDEPTLENNDGYTVDGSGTGLFSSSLTSLTRLTDYTVRAYATNSAGTVYSLELYLKTLPDPPAITTSEVTQIGAHVALCGGEITELGGAEGAHTGIYWSTSPNVNEGNYEGYWIAMELIYVDPGEDPSFEAILSGLQPGTTYYVRAFVNNSGAFYVYGEEKSFATLSFAETVQTGTFTDTRDNYQYNTVTINGQTWLAENLVYLPDVCASDASCGYWVYDYQGTDVNAAKAHANYADYGVLYNWEMAKTGCPDGWHLPTTEEWSLLEINLGMNYQSAFVLDAYRGTDEGDKIKSGTSHWIGNYPGTNSASFNALPGGIRDVLDDTFKWLGTNCTFWTSSTWGSPELNIINRNLGNSTPMLGKGSYSQIPYENNGFSVRCVQD